MDLGTQGMGHRDEFGDIPGNGTQEFVAQFGDIPDNVTPGLTKFLRGE